ncbi:MAG: LysM peptidoglycan-binding domain-containing protein [Pseudomonadota bacterium]
MLLVTLPATVAMGADDIQPMGASAGSSALSHRVPDERRDDRLLDAQDQPTWLTLEDFQSSPVVPARPWNDLLQQMRDSFSLSWTMNPRIEAEMRWFLRHPEYLDRVFTRAQRFLPHIMHELEQRNLPMEIALLPVVESAFDPFAYSHGRAAGLWQIIPGTGRRFGIEQNWWYDGRRDILDSTRGALDYLTALHEMMDGDWLLAIASYNSGEGNVLRGVRRNRKAGKPADFWNIRVPKETSTYVPRLLALVEIVRDPAAYELSLPAIVDETQFEVVETGSQIDLALAAGLAGIDMDTLYAFNPGLNRWATDPTGPHRLVLPVGHRAAFAESLAAVPEDQRVRWKRHKVRSGQTISEIADYYDTTVAEVRTANNLRGNTIRAGAYLMIPMATEPLTAYVKSADARRDQIQNATRSGHRVEHIVAAGESFWAIGRRYDVGTRELAKWNGMAPRDTLSVGQKLVVWTDDAPTETPRSKTLTRKLNYTVRRGDSLYRIASRFRITISDLVRWNSIDKNKILRPGQRLTMYVDVTDQSS